MMKGTNAVRRQIRMCAMLWLFTEPKKLVMRDIFTTQQTMSFRETPHVFARRDRVDQNDEFERAVGAFFALFNSIFRENDGLRTG